MELASPGAGSASAGEASDGNLGRLDCRVRCPELRLYQIDRREGPHGNRDRLALVVRQGIFHEVVVDDAHHLVEGEWVRVARGDLVVRLIARALNVLSCQRKDDTDDVVDGDDVEDRIGQARELREPTLAVGHDERVGDLVSVDPAGEGVRDSGFDDGGTHETQAVA